MKKLITLTTLTLALTACGSGASTQSTGFKPSTPSFKPPVTVNPLVNGRTTISDADLTTINKLTVNGKVVQLVPNDFKGDIYKDDDRLIGTQLTHARYGFFEDKVFAKGVPTKEMPTIGSATYTGKGFHFENDKLDTDVTNLFNVFFHTKTLTGYISRPEGGRLRLSANISGNGFNGTSTDVRSGQIRTISTKGAFYGPNGVELAGFYNDDKGTMTGAFGAKR